MNASVADELAAHVFGDGAPCDSLLNAGQFPAGWTDKYLCLLRVASEQWVHEPMWPRQLVAAVHFASWYLNLRYDVWCRHSGRRNLQTEKELSSLRSPSEIFIMVGSTALAPPEVCGG